MLPNPALRERFWHIEVRSDGSEWLHFNGGSRPAGGLALAGTAGMSLEERNRALAGKMKYTEVRPGAFEAAPRIPDMDQDGITQAVLYPTMLLGLPSIDDPEFAEVQANAYNEWLAAFCSHAPTRLFGVAVVPAQDVERAVRTIRRAKGQGHVGVFMRPNPSILRLSGRRLGFLLNFGEALMKDGITRAVNGLSED